MVAASYTPFLPPTISGSWHWSGNWLMLNRQTADQKVQPYPARCPLCKGGWRLAGFMVRPQPDSTDGSAALVHDSTMLQCEKCKEILPAGMVMKCNENEDFDLGGEL